MPTIFMWLPLTGKVIGTENRKGKVIVRGDNANPIRAVDLWKQWFTHLRATDITFDSKTSTFNMQTVLEEVDIIKKQAYVKITAPQEFLDWMDTTVGLVNRTVRQQLGNSKRSSVLQTSGEIELIDDIPVPD